MLKGIAKGFLDILVWSESCSCHYEFLHGDFGEDDELPDAVRLEAEKCPLRGMRCHDVCAGDLVTFVKVY